jgi:hypothetical protein
MPLCACLVAPFRVTNSEVLHETGGHEARSGAGTIVSGT